MNFHASTYADIGNELFRRGLVGRGLREDLLVESARRLDRPLVPGGGCLGDFFAAALEHHVALLFAVDVGDGPESGADLHALLEAVLAAIAWLPLPLMRKSPRPLRLVVASGEARATLGCHLLERGGPSILFWDTFRCYRPLDTLRPYGPLAVEIRRTLVHEVVGHQLAFCVDAAAPVTRADVLDILRLMDVDTLDLLDGRTVSPAEALAHGELLTCLRRVRYLASHRFPGRYLTSPLELIAFAVDGSSPDAGIDYESVRRILRRSLLRVPTPLNRAEGPFGTLYQGFDLALDEPRPYYIEELGDAWEQTDAVSDGSRWLSLADLRRQFLAGDEGRGCERRRLEPGEQLALHVSMSGWVLATDQARVLLSPFGILRAGEAHRAPVSSLGIPHVGVRGVDPTAAHHGLFKIENLSPRPLAYRLARIEATTRSISDASDPRTSS